MKTILILGAGIEQTIAIRLAKKMKLIVIAVDGNSDAPGLKIADVGIHCNINDVDKIIEIGKQYKVNGIFCHAVEIPIVVAKVATSLGLPGILIEVAERATKKSFRIKRFKEKGVNCPDFEVVKNIDQAKEAAERIGYPVVIKPLDNAGARGVVRVNTIDEIEKSVSYALKFTKSKNILVEEYLNGFELSTESVVLNGKIYNTAYSDRNYAFESNKFFVEDGGNMPTSLSPDVIKLVDIEIEKAINALGLDNSPAKGDILIRQDKVYVLEMSCRTSGGFFCSLQTPLSNGIQIIKPLIQMAMGDKPNPKDLLPKFQKGSVERYIFANEEGTIKSINGVKEAKEVPGIEHCFVWGKPGDKLHKLVNNTGKLGIIIATADTREKAIKRARHAVSKIKVEVEENV